MAPVYAAADHGTNGSGLTLNPAVVAQRALSLVGASTPLSSSTPAACAGSFLAPSSASSRRSCRCVTS
jgi:hypothetical protein